MTIEQRLDLERDDRRHESTQARLGGRLKSAWRCRQCGREDGMRSIHREVLASLSVNSIGLLTALHSEPGDDEYLFYPCRYCNSDGIIPDGLELLSLQGALDWIQRGRGPAMEPNYDALAAEEPVSQITDARDSAGI